MALHSAGVLAAAFSPSAAQPPDPPTGVVVTRQPEEPLPPAQMPDALSLRMTLGPVRYSGRASLSEARTVSHGTASTTRTLTLQMDFSSYVWQPWFVQLSGSIGGVHSRSGQSGDAMAAGPSSSSAALFGSVNATVFPSSRFPFQFNVSVTDSRAGSELVETDYRSIRVGLQQSYRTADTDDQYLLRYDRSRQHAIGGDGDTLHNLSGNAQWARGPHSLSGAAQLSIHKVDGDGDDSRNLVVHASHFYRPRDVGYDISSTATLVDSRRASPAAGTRDHNSLRQLTAFGNWRPLPGEWFYREDLPLTLTASARLSDSDSDSGGGGERGRGRGVSASLGASTVLRQRLRLGVSGGLSYQDSNGRGDTRVNLGASASYSFEPVSFGEWRYMPNVAANLSWTQDSVVGGQSTLGLSGSHGLSRSFRLGQDNALSLQLMQSLSATGYGGYEPRRPVSLGLTHSAALGWSVSGDAGSHTYASASVSDSRTRDEVSGSFQMVNLQFTRRTQLSRRSGWSGTLTAQASRGERPLLDTVTGLISDPGVQDWQPFYSGSLTYHAASLFNVPHLYLNVQYSLNSQLISTRADGDLDAARQLINHSFEARLEHVIGRLSSKLSLRAIRVEDREIGSLNLTLSRSF